MTEYRGMQSKCYTLGYDQVGTLKTVADTDGKLIKQRQYDSFGNMFHDTAPHMFIPIGFAGGIHDRDTELVRFGRRDYLPEAGRWTAKDPIGLAGGDSDLYGYCLDDPINYFDSEGLEADCISIDGNASGFGGRVEAGGGICWDDKGDWRFMGHADAGAGSSFSAGVAGTYQTTTANTVDELAGQSMVTGGSTSVPIPVPLPLVGTGNVNVGADKIFADKYTGTAGSVGVGIGSWAPDVHAQSQNTKLW